MRKERNTDTCLPHGAICHHTQTLISIHMLQNLFTPVDKAKTGDINATQEGTISKASIITMSMHHIMDTTHGIMTLLSKSLTMITLMMSRHTMDKT